MSYGQYGHRTLYKRDGMLRTKALTKDPFPFTLPEILTVAHVLRLISMHVYIDTYTCICTYVYVCII